MTLEGKAGGEGIEAVLQAAIGHHQAGRLAEAEGLYRQVLQAEPEHADALHLLGLIAHQVGRQEMAAVLIAQAIRSRPTAVMYSNLGLVFGAQGKMDLAVECLRQAVQLQPDNVEAHNNLGNLLKAQGRLDEAIAHYRLALELNPAHGQAFINLGTALKDQGKLAEAIESYRCGLALLPDSAEAHFNLGNAFDARGWPDEAAASFRQAIQLKPDFTAAYRNLGVVCQSQGHLAEAADCYQKSIALQPSNALRIACDLMLPAIMGTKDEVLASRTVFENNLQRLMAEGLSIADPIEEGCQPNFYLAFQGLDDKEIQQKVARFYEQACPRLLFVAPHCRQARKISGRIRIGFLSKYIFHHSVSICFKRIVEELARREQFEVILISSHDYEEASAQDTYARFIGKQVFIPHDLVGAQEAIAELELDILVYLDIGMEPSSYFLAFSRLAPFQCVLGGHPVTTGIGNVDYYLSAGPLEVAEADRHYSEKLVRFPTGLFFFEKPNLPNCTKTRRDFGLPEAGRLYACPMKLQKLHPDFDEAIAKILQQDRGGYVVLFKDEKYSNWDRLLRARFDKTIPASVRARILFLPWLANYADFIAINALADVVLDPFHFGIGSTAIATCFVGTPFVTKPGEFHRGRVGYLFCKSLDVMECVAADLEDYVSKAVAIATDRSLRDSVSSKILANQHALLENQQPIKDLAEFFLGLATLKQDK